MRKYMKIITFYLPQFHKIPENDQWWGEGFTEWNNVKKAEPLFPNHYQPRIPFNENYYDLSDINVMKWQVKLAKDHGIYGFCFYHYWFNGKLLLQKPVEQFLAHQEINLPFCICWANEHWTNGWVSGKFKVLIEQTYGAEKEWKEHFDYLLPFLKDERYITNNGKPLVVIYRPEIIDCIDEMLDYWQKLALENGFQGLDFAYQYVGFNLEIEKDVSRFSYNIEMQPISAFTVRKIDQHKQLRKIKYHLFKFLETKFSLVLKFYRPYLERYSYDEIWEIILSMTPKNEKNIPGAFVDWDNTPRRGRRGSVCFGASPEKFEKYLSKQIIRAKNVYKKDMIFLFAWNEWAEGGYMEPDVQNGHGNLSALKNALIKNNEFPAYP